MLNDRRKSRDRAIPKLPYKEAAIALIKLGVKNSTHFETLKKNNRIPAEVPARPDMYYKEEWGSWKEFLAFGKENIDSDIVTPPLNYFELKAANRRLGITQKALYLKAIDDKRLPEGTPSNPDEVYAEHWEGWNAFLAEDLKYISYNEAKKFVHQLGLKNSLEWRVYCREGKRPSCIPALPERTYEDFVSWEDFLGVVEH